MSRKFTVQSQITGIRALADGGLSLNIHTKELPAIEKVTVMDFQNKVGWLLFSENEIQEEEIPTIDADIERKSQSSRIRACLFVLWKQLGQADTFENFYTMETEKIINTIKNRLD